MSSSSHKPVGITQSYFPECESVRGMAISLVLIFHVSQRWIGRGRHVEEPGIFESYMLAGDTGVTLFFVLSGFLLSLPLIRSGQIDLKRFFKKRALRILPLYLLMISIGGIYHSDMRAFIQALFFWDIRFTTLPPFGSVGWSLMVEVQFYLLLPLLFLCWNNRQTRPLLILIFMSFITGYMHITGRWDFVPGDWSLGLNLHNTVFARWPAFLCGIMLASLHQHAGQGIKAYCWRNPLLNSGASDLLLLLAVTILGLTLQITAKMSILLAYIYFFDRIIYEAILWTVIIAALLYLPLKSSLLFINPLWHFLGIISYSLYLWHLVALRFGPKLLIDVMPSLAPFSHHQKLIVGVVLALIISVISYFVIERPFLTLKEKR